MTHHLQASADAFVIRLADEATLDLLREEFGQVGSLETLPAHPELALLQLRAGGGDPKRLWRKLQATLGDMGSIMPVFRDAEDAALYPVGDILVRFKGSPSDHLLGEWAREQVELEEASAEVVAEEGRSPASFRSSCGSSCSSCRYS